MLDEGIRIFEKVKPDVGFIDEILTFDARKLDVLKSSTISKYATALSQYLIYFKAETNKAKISVHQKERALMAGLAQVLTKEIMNKYKTKTAATQFIISNSPELTIIKNDIDKLKDELMLVEGVDKMISDLVATLKRELTRRENELYTVRRERYS